MLWSWLCVRIKQILGAIETVNVEINLFANDFNKKVIKMICVKITSKKISGGNIIMVNEVKRGQVKIQSDEDYFNSSHI